MSLADEVLATHRPEPDSQAEYDNCSGCAGTWPCESVRLALSLHAAEQVVEAARDYHREYEDGPGLFPDIRPLAAALAEYDKGGQG